MSIESNIYNILYEGFERKANRVAELHVEGGDKKIEEIAKKFKRSSLLFRGTEFCLAGVGVCSLTALYNHLTGSDCPDSLFRLNATIAMTTPLLATHFHYATNLDKVLLKRILGKPVEDLNAKQIKRWERIGRYAHLSSVATLFTGISPELYAFCRDHLMIAIPAIGVLSFCAYHNYIEGYRALYASMADFILGQRRHGKQESKLKTSDSMDHLGFR